MDWPSPQELHAGYLPGPQCSSVLSLDLWPKDDVRFIALALAPICVRTILRNRICRNQPAVISSALISLFIFETWDVLSFQFLLYTLKILKVHPQFICIPSRRITLNWSYSVILLAYLWSKLLAITGFHYLDISETKFPSFLLVNFWKIWMTWSGISQSLFVTAARKV